jgi:phage gpG-like protein
VVTVKFESLGTTHVERKLLGWSDRARNLKPAFERVHSLFLEIERKQFDTEGRSGSGGWAPLADSTRTRKAARGQDPRILRSTERLFRSLTEPVFGDHISRITEDEAFFGTKVPYAVFHQQGGSNAARIANKGYGLSPGSLVDKPKASKKVRVARFNQARAGLGLPRRPPVELTESQRKTWIKVIQAHLRASDR